jgi:predicted nucleotidyltransferase
VDNILKLLENEHEILFAYLFGSYAKGVQHKQSDIDIAIFLKNPDFLEKDPLYPSRLAIKMENLLGNKRSVDIRVLNGSTLIFRNQVLKFGKLLLSKNEKERIEFETSSLAQYYDFKPHLELYDTARKARLGL